MHKTTTHFEQVSLETVRKITEQFGCESATDDEINTQPLEKEFAKAEAPSMTDVSYFLKG